MLKLVWICYFMLIQEIGQIQATVLNTETTCYGNFLNLTCSGGHQIAIPELAYMAKENRSIWTDCNPIDGNLDDHCCQYNAVNDCYINVFSTIDTVYPDVFSNCTGFESCFLRANWVQTTGGCSIIHFDFTSYLLAKYQCIPESQIISLGETSSNMENTEVYLQTPQYPKYTDDYVELLCSIETLCNTSIVLTLIDVDMTCGGRPLDLNCDANNEYRMTTTTIEYHFKLLRADILPGSRLWIKLSANESSTSLDVRCGIRHFISEFPIQTCGTTESTTAISTSLTTESYSSTTSGTSYSPDRTSTSQTPAPSQSSAPALTNLPHSPDRTSTSQTPAPSQSSAPALTNLPHSSDRTSTSASTSQTAIPSMSQVSNESSTDVPQSTNPTPTASDSTLDITLGVVLSLVVIIIIVGIIIGRYIYKKHIKNMTGAANDEMTKIENNQMCTTSIQPRVLARSSKYLHWSQP